MFARETGLRGRLIVSACVLGSAIGRTVFAVDPPTVAWWRMEARQGNQIPDLSGNDHTLTVQGSPTFQGSAVVFNDDGLLFAADADDLDLASGDWTVSFWARPDSNDHSPNSNNTNVWLCKHHSSSEGGWCGASDPLNGFGTYLYGSPNCSDNTDEALTLGAWYHISTTYADATNTLRIYVNGVEKHQAANTCTVLANVRPVVFGGDEEGGGSLRPYCKGAMADIRIWDAELSQADIQELFAKGVPQVPALSSLGAFAAILLTLTLGTVVFMRRCKVG